MFNSIKTSKENRERVTQLTKRLNLGAENTIARLAFAYSLSTDKRLNLAEIEDSQGKEYNYKVLFGDYGIYYIAMICVHYDLHKTDRDIPKYIKMHVDDGLKVLEQEVAASKNSLGGVDFIINKIEAGLYQQ